MAFASRFLGVRRTAQLALSTLFIMSCSAASVDGSSAWQYGEGESGTKNWPAIEPKCNGTRQSPIRLQNAIFNSTLSHVRFEGYHAGEGKMFTMINDGHSAKLKLPKIFYLAGDDLGGRYVADSVHFHWGKADTLGSEHTYRGRRFPMEMHIVHIHEQYTDLKEVEVNGSSDSLAVTAFLFEIAEEDNVHLEKVVNSLQFIRQPDRQHNVSGFPLDHLMPAHHHYYYRYEGSLTVPNCMERVMWTVFADTIPISTHQLAQFRLLKSNGGYGLYNNFRPEQALNDRRVYTNIFADGYRFAGDPANLGSAGTRREHVLLVVALVFTCLGRI